MKTRFSTRGISLPFILLFLALIIPLLYTSSTLVYNEIKAHEAKRVAHRLYLMKEGAIHYLISKMENNEEADGITLTFESGYAFIINRAKNADFIQYEIHIYDEAFNYVYIVFTYHYKDGTYTVT
ncbi:MAG TPA: hypothetical protein VIK63_03160 [Haloplasmataceae bacterium]